MQKLKIPNKFQISYNNTTIFVDSISYDENRAIIETSASISFDESKNFSRLESPVEEEVESKIEDFLSKKKFFIFEFEV